MNAGATFAAFENSMDNRKIHFTEEDNLRLSESIKKRSLYIYEIEHSAPLIEYSFSQIDQSRVAQRVKRTLDLRLGIFYAILPEGIKPSDVENWAWGQKRVWAIPRIRMLYSMTFVRRFLSGSSRRVLGQNPYMTLAELEPGDWENLAVFGDELYWELAGPVAESFTITSLPLGSYPWILYFYHSIAEKRKTLDDNAIDEIVERLVGLAVGALDEDTYLIWWRTTANHFPEVLSRRYENEDGAIGGCRWPMPHHNSET